jgi:hypothetical protein
MKYLLIEDTDEPGARVTICDTLEDRNRRTLETIYGSLEEAAKHQEAADADLETLADERTLSFEGDPSIHWIDAIEIETTSHRSPTMDAEADANNARKYGN